MESKKQCIYEFGPFVLDLVQHVLLRDHRPLAVMPKTFDTLLVLVKNSSRLLSKAELMQALWPDSFVEESNLTVQISAVRKILGDQQAYIVTVPGRGYRFSAEVKETAQTTAPAITAPAVLPASIREATATGDAEARSRDWATSGTLALHEVPRPETVPVRSRRYLYYAAIVCGVALSVIFLVVKLRPALPLPRVLGYTQLTDSGRVDELSDILTDGTRVYFAAHPAGSKDQQLYQASVFDKETAEIPIPFSGFFLCDISPDRSQLLVASSPEKEGDHPFWILSVLGGSPRRVGDITGGDAKWTPDGKAFIYSRGTNVFLAGSDGRGSRKLLSTPGFASGFRWSPDRRVIRFTVTDQSTSLNSIWEASSDGSHLHALLPGWNSPSTETEWGDWTADGRYFVFGSTREEKYEIWAIREKRDYLHKMPHGPVPVSTGPARVIRPRLSVDGKRLFAVSVQYKGELFRFDPGSSQFVPFLAGLSAHRLSFSNDGRWMTYVSYPEGELWRSRIDGTDKLRLTFAPIGADLPRWSPDGSQIVFEDRPGGRPGDMFLVPSSGGDPKRLLPQGMTGSNPDWSPDGKLIAFGPQPTFQSAPNAAGGTTGPGAMIHMLNANTRKISDLPGSTGLYWPCWSTDGRYIAALSVDTHRLMLFDNRMQKWTQLASGATLHNPLWCRDGKTLYFQDLGAPSQPVYRLNIRSHVQQRIGGPGPLSQPDTIYSALTGLSPDDSPIILEIHSMDDIYALDILLP
jgi:DNA-binding winged helix-turn-helix (wHTH) protein/Tol biopolymer transport system component